MTAKAALCLALLEGRVLNVGNCFREIGLTNIAREIPRMVETPFKVEVSRTPKIGKNRYGVASSYVNYRLNITLYNSPGVELMRKYAEENGGKVPVGRPKQTEAVEVKKEEVKPMYTPQKLF